MSQQGVADRAGVTRQHYQLLESGTGNPAVGTLIKIAGAFDVALGELLNFLA